MPRYCVDYYIRRNLAKRNFSGFSLVEIMVVVLIIALLAAVSITQLLRARIVVHEQLALSALRLISRSCHFFYSANVRFPAALVDLGPPTSNPPYVDSSLTTGSPPTRQGYQFVYSAPVNRQTFVLLVNPQVHGTTGIRHFYVDEQLSIHGTDQNRDATPADPDVP